MDFIANNVKWLSSLLGSRLQELRQALRSDGTSSRVRTEFTARAPLFDMLLGLSQEDRDAVQQMDIDASCSIDDIEAISHTAPPGEEGFDISHEGEEFEVFEDLAAGLAETSG